MVVGGGCAHAVVYPAASATVIADARARSLAREREWDLEGRRKRERERETERERKGRTERRERSRDTVFAARRVRSLVYVYLAEKERLSARAVRRIKKKKGESACYVCLTTNPVT